jgi:hypothetical protein
VKFEDVIVVALIAWLKVAVMTGAVTETFVAPPAGVTAVTIGAVGAAAVVKAQESFAASATPAESVAPVVIVAVYCVLYVRFTEGVNVAIEPVAA